MFPSLPAAVVRRPHFYCLSVLPALQVTFRFLSYQHASPFGNTCGISQQQCAAATKKKSFTSSSWPLKWSNPMSVNAGALLCKCVQAKRVSLSGFAQAYSQAAGGGKPVGRVRQAWTKIATLVSAFMSGTKALYQDIKRISKLERERGSRFTIRRTAPNLDSLSKNRFSFGREEVQFIYITRREMWKMLPTIVLFFIPLLGYAVPLIVFAFPDKMLSQHFWTDDQKKRYSQQAFQSRTEKLKSLAVNLHKTAPAEILSTLSTIKKQIHNGDVSAEDMTVPVHRKQLSREHLHDLASSWGVSSWLHSSLWPKLERHMHYVYTVDWLILNEGGAEKLTNEEVEQACIERGMAVDSSPSRKVEMLNQWISISTKFKECPDVLLAYLPLLQFQLPQES